MIMLSCLDARMPALAERSRAALLTSCLSVQQIALQQNQLMYSHYWVSEPGRRLMPGPRILPLCQNIAGLYAVMLVNSVWILATWLNAPYPMRTMTPSTVRFTSSFSHHCMSTPGNEGDILHASQHPCMSCCADCAWPALGQVSAECSKLDWHEEPM